MEMDSEKEISRRAALRMGALATAGAAATAGVGTASAKAASAAPPAAGSAARTSTAKTDELGHEDRQWDSPLSWANPELADLLLYNGQIVTVDGEFSIQQAMAVKDGIIVAVGSNADLRARFTGSTTIDLQGKTVLPGFNDCHSHARTFDYRSIGDLQGVDSIERIQRRIAAKIAELAADEWVRGSGYDETIFEEGRKPTRWDLDEAAPGTPVHLVRQGGHSSVANSKALEIAGITDDTPDPEGGVIERDEDGVATGILVETASGLVRGHIPGLTPEQTRQGTIDGLKAYLPLGITSFTQAAGSANGFNAWESIYAEHGADLPRASYYITTSSSLPTDVAPFEGDDRLRATALKLFADGGFTGPDARLSLPYRGIGDGTFRGNLRRTPDQLLAFFRDATAAGWPVGIHTAGDGAEALVIDALAKVLSEAPAVDIRHHLMHFEVQLPEASLQRMRQYGIGVVQQTNFLWSLEGLYDRYLWPIVREDVAPAGSFLRHEVRFANSADVIPTGPMLGMQTSVTRQGRSGRRYAVAQERFTLEEAIRAYTVGGAYMTHQEDVKGSLEAGKFADFVVLSHDIFRVRPEYLIGMRVLETHIGGKLVYERPANERPETEGKEATRPSGGREGGPEEFPDP